MKTTTLIIIGIIIGVTISIIFVTLAYNQEIKLATGIIQTDSEPSDQYPEFRADDGYSSERYDSNVLQCFRLLYNCDISSEYFEGCIGGKIDGVTIEEICSSSDIVIDDGCAKADFGDGTFAIICE